MKNYFYKLGILRLLLIAISFTSCEPESESNEDQTNSCSDARVINYLSECTWFITDGDNTSISDISIDFTSQNIHAYNSEEQIVDEGNWSIEEGVISFNMLTSALIDYAGNWTVVSCDLGILELEKGDKQITISSSDCNYTN